MRKQLLGLIAIGIAISASAFTAPNRHFTNVKWRPLYNNMNVVIGWQNVDGLQEGSDYTCLSSIQTCTAEFPAGTTPTASTPIPAGSEPGQFH